MWSAKGESTPGTGRRVTTTTESPVARRSHLDVTLEEFERRPAEHGHSADEIHHLWDELALGVSGERGEGGRERRGVPTNAGPPCSTATSA